MIRNSNPSIRCLRHIKQIIPAVAGTRAVFVYLQKDGTVETVVAPVHAWGLVSEQWQDYDDKRDTWVSKSDDDDDPSEEHIIGIVEGWSAGTLTLVDDEPETGVGEERLCEPVAYLEPGEGVPLEYEPEVSIRHDRLKSVIELRVQEWNRHYEKTTAETEKAGKP